MADRRQGRPRIGIPIALEERRGDARPYQYVNREYAAAVEAAGGVPLLLPLQDDATALIEVIDGLLIPGGNDFLPRRPYPATVRFEPVAEDQLAFDRSVLGAVREQGLPVLAICYGMQLLAVSSGGRLHYDIASDVPDALDHQHRGRAGHPIALEPSSQLAALVGPTLTAVNTHHHQAVADPGRGLRVAARAPDGVIEAIEATDGSFCVGVQWHPERSDTAAERALLRGFVERCRKPAA